MSPEPGTTSVPSSANTLASSPIVKCAVAAAEPGPLIELAMPTASLEPSESSRNMLPRATSFSFTSVLHITPEEMMSPSDEMS